MGKIIISIAVSCLFLTGIARAGEEFKPVKQFLNGGGTIICSLGKIPHFLLVRASRKDYPLGLIPGLGMALKETVEGIFRGGADVVMPQGEQFSSDCLITRMVINKRKGPKPFLVSKK